MKVTINRKRLLQAFSDAASVSPRRSPKPILQNVKLETGADQTVILSATDLEIGIRVELQSESIEAPGSCLLPVQKFGALIRESIAETVEIEASDQQIKVKADRTKAKLGSSDPGEFPDVNAEKPDSYYEIEVAKLKELIRKSSICCDEAASSYALGGTLVESQGNTIRGISTDGKRMAVASCQAKPINIESFGEQRIIPKRTMNLIASSLPDGGMANLAIGDRDAMVWTSRSFLRARLIEGRFPQWQRVMPDYDDTTPVNLTIPVGPFLSAVRQASITLSQESVGLDLEFTEGQLAISGETSEIGGVRSEIPVPHSGEPVTTCLDHRLLAQFLALVGDGAQVQFAVQDGDSAAYFSDGTGCQHVIMPLGRA